MCILVLVLGLIYKGKLEITKSDTLFLILGLTSLVLWLLAKQPILSTILTTLAGLLGFIPTVRKSWHDPYSETLIFYILNTIRFVLATISLEHYSLITAMYPITWLLVNGSFSGLLISRRRNCSSNR